MHTSKVRGITWRIKERAAKERALRGMKLFGNGLHLNPVEIRTLENNSELDILAKEGISIDILQEAPPDKVIFRPNLSMKKIWTVS